MEKIQHGASSTILGMAFDEASDTLYVRFKQGTVYSVTANKMHSEIDPMTTIRDAFIAEGEKLDGSIGKLYNTLIKSQPSTYPAVALGPEDVPVGIPI